MNKAKGIRVQGCLIHAPTAPPRMSRKVIHATISGTGMTMCGFYREEVFYKDFATLLKSHHPKQRFCRKCKIRFGQRLHNLLATAYKETS